MKEKLSQLFGEKGLQVPDKDYEELTESWRELLSKREHLNKELLNDCDIAVRYIPGGGSDVS